MRAIFLGFTAIVVFCFLVSCSSGSKVGKSDGKYTYSFDDKGKPIIAGPISWDEWKHLATWHSYDAAPGAFDMLKAKLITKTINSSDYKLLLFAGAWCEDSEVQVPIIMDVLIKTGVNTEKFNLFGVDRDKREGSGTAAKFKIEKVPTLIILKSGKEIGRIVESPKVSWEDDMRTLIFTK